MLLWMQDRLYWWHTGHGQTSVLCTCSHLLLCLLPISFSPWHFPFLITPVSSLWSPPYTSHAPQRGNFPLTHKVMPSYWLHWIGLLPGHQGCGPLIVLGGAELVLPYPSIVLPRTPWCFCGHKLLTTWSRNNLSQQCLQTSNNYSKKNKWMIYSLLIL